MTRARRGRQPPVAQSGGIAPGDADRAPQRATPPANVLDLVDRTLQRGMRSWSSTLQLIALFLTFSGGLAGLVYVTLHAWLGVTSWISVLTSASTTGIGSFAAVWHHGRRTRRP